MTTVTRPRPPRGTALTARELDVLSRAANGATNAETAAALGLTADTIKTHMSRAYSKLGVRDRAHAVSVAYQRGLLGSRPVPDRLSELALLIERHDPRLAVQLGALANRLRREAARR